MMTFSEENLMACARGIDAHFYSRNPSMAHLKWWHEHEESRKKPMAPKGWKELSNPEVTSYLVKHDNHTGFIWIGDKKNPRIIKINIGDDIYFGKDPFTGHNTFLIIAHMNGKEVDIIRPW